MFITYTYILSFDYLIYYCSFKAISNFYITFLHDFLCYVMFLLKNFSLYQSFSNYLYYKYNYIKIISNTF